MTLYHDNLWTEAEVTCVGVDGNSFCCNFPMPHLVSDQFDSIWGMVKLSQRQRKEHRGGLCLDCEEALADWLGIDSVETMHRIADRDGVPPRGRMRG